MRANATTTGRRTGQSCRPSNMHASGTRRAWRSYEPTQLCDPRGRLASPQQQRQPRGDWKLQLWLLAGGGLAGLLFSLFFWELRSEFALPRNANENVVLVTIDTLRADA